MEEEEVFPDLFENLEKLKFPGEKTRHFFLLGYGKNNFLEKDIFKLQFVGKQLIKLLIQHLTHTHLNFIKVKNFDISTSHLAKVRKTTTSNLKLSLFFQKSSLLQQPLSFFQMSQISMELAW